LTTVISFINYKGGVGKTTTAYHVSSSLAQHYGQRVLMIDIDPQTNLTFLCASIDQWQARKEDVGTITNLYRRFAQDQVLDVKRFIWRDAVSIGRHPIFGLDLIPCDIDLLGEDLSSGQVISTYSPMQMLQQTAQQYLHERSFLTEVIDEVRGDYDWVVIDCPPNLYLMTQNALFASDFYVVTAIPDHLSTIGLNILAQKVARIGAEISQWANFADWRNFLSQKMEQPLPESKSTPGIAQLGAIVFVMVRIGGSRVTNTHGETMDEIASELFAEGKVVSQYTTELIGYSEAAENRVPVWEHNTENARRAARKNEYPEITQELLAMLRGTP